MAKILYRATLPGGQPQAGYVEAETEKEAVAALKARGCTAIGLYESVPVARLYPEREKFSSTHELTSAALQVAMWEAPGWKTFFKTVVRFYWWQLLLVALFIVGAAWGRNEVLLIPAFFVLLGWGHAAWSSRAVIGLVRLCESAAIGDWAAVQRLGERLHKIWALRKPTPGVLNALFAVEIKIAQAEIAQAGPAHLPAVLQRLQKWQSTHPVPGLYENQLALLHHKAGDYPAFVALMRAASAAAPQHTMLRVDEALAEARLGDAAQAARLLEELDPEILTVYGRPFHSWIAGLIALRQNRGADALAHLQAAVDGFLAFGKNPITWTSFALCSGACALALADAARIDEARQLAQRVWPILKVHGDQPLLAMLGRAGLAGP